MNLQKRYAETKRQRQKEIDRMVSQAQFATAQAYKEYRRVLSRRQEQPADSKFITTIDPHWLYEMGCVGINSTWDMEQAQMEATGISRKPEKEETFLPRDSVQDAILSCVGLK